MELTIHPVTSERWADLERLFGPNGAYSGCWCMYWRLKSAEFDRATREERKAGLQALADSPRPPGILAYLADEPVAWVSIGPRESFGRLERSRTRPRVDDAAIWSIVCFFVAKPWRRQGLMASLLRGAVAYAARQGATIVEGYPVDPPAGARVSGGTEGYVGFASAFRAAGFVEVLRPAERRPVMRYVIGDSES